MASLKDAALGYAANPLPADRENKGKIVYA